MPAPYLLDTTVLLHWVRGSEQARIIDQQFQLSATHFRPVICEVSLGEMRAFARSLGWRPKKLERLREIAHDFTAIDISEPRVLDAYAEISTLSMTYGWSIFHDSLAFRVHAFRHSGSNTTGTPALRDGIWNGSSWADECPRRWRRPEGLHYRFSAD